MIPQTLPPKPHFAVTRPHRGPQFGALAWTPDRGEQLKEAVKKGEVMFWDVDTQKGFMWPIFIKRVGDAMKRIGLQVPGAEAITGTLKKLTALAQQYGIPMIATMDTHDKKDPEFAIFEAISDEHCVYGHEDWEKIPETVPAGVNKQRHIVVSPRTKDVPTPDDLRALFADGNQVVLQKNTINFLERRVGKTPETKRFVTNGKAVDLLENLKQLGIKIAVVYGVATDFCVQGAVSSLKKMGFQPIVVEDAIKEINGGEKALHDPQNPIYADVPVIQSGELEKILKAAKEDAKHGEDSDQPTLTWEKILKAAKEDAKPQTWQLAGFPSQAEHEQYLQWKEDENLNEIGQPAGTPHVGFLVPPMMKLYDVLVEKHPAKPWLSHKSPLLA